MTTIPFLTYRLSNRGIHGDAQKALEMIESQKKGLFVSTINANSAVEASQDALFYEAQVNADLLIPDGFSIVLASRFCGQEIPERVSGYDFFWAFSQIAQQRKGISYFFLGSSETVLQLIQTRLEKDFPDIKLAGTYSPPFKPSFTEEDNQKMCEAINSSGANVLWVGMTAPKQEKWIHQNRHRLNVNFAAAIGAVFDFYAQTKSRAPVWVQKIGCEWLHRLLTEPKRVWRRYLINNPKFISLVFAWRFKKPDDCHKNAKPPLC